MTTPVRRRVSVPLVGGLDNRFKFKTLRSYVVEQNLARGNQLIWKAQKVKSERFPPPQTLDLIGRNWHRKILKDKGSFRDYISMEDIPAAEVTNPRYIHFPFGPIKAEDYLHLLFTNIQAKEGEFPHPLFPQKTLSPDEMEMVFSQLKKIFLLDRDTIQSIYSPLSKRDYQYLANKVQEKFAGCEFSFSLSPPCVVKLRGVTSTYDKSKTFSLDSLDYDFTVISSEDIYTAEELCFAIQEEVRKVESLLLESEHPSAPLSETAKQAKKAQELAQLNLNFLGKYLVTEKGISKLIHCAINPDGAGVETNTEIVSSLEEIGVFARDCLNQIKREKINQRYLDFFSYFAVTEDFPNIKELQESFLTHSEYS